MTLLEVLSHTGVTVAYRWHEGALMVADRRGAAIQTPAGWMPFPLSIADDYAGWQPLGHLGVPCVAAPVA